MILHKHMRNGRLKWLAKHKKGWLTGLLMLLLTPAIGQQPVVYPGDANRDGRCDKDDILSIGLAHGESGPQRPNPGVIDWAPPQIATPWGSGLPVSNVDLAYVDCNGDGTVDDEDTSAVERNYYRTNTDSQATPKDTVDLNGERAAFRFQPVTGVVYDNDTLTVDIFSESPGYPNIPDTVYGMSFTVAYDTSVIRDGATNAFVRDSWIGDTTQTVHTAKIVDSSMAQKKGFANKEIGRADYAISRTDQSNTDGSGNVAGISIVMEDDLHLKPNFDSTLVLRFEDIVVITDDEKHIRVQSFTDTVTVKRRKTGIRAKKQDEHNGFRVYPNPASSTCHIAFHRDVEPQAVRLYNRQGELVRHQQVEGGGHVTLPVQQVETGVYMIRIISEKGVHSKQVMIGR